MDDPRPAPAPGPLTAPYWEAARSGELALQHCAGCGRIVHFPEPACPFCGGTELPYRAVSGEGIVHTHTEVHRTFLPGFATPYTLAWIDLPEGARVFGDVTGAVHIGQRVRVHFPVRAGFGPIPSWRPVP
ncbi:Zn-ribbon domain-containing OB-fold protein [Actinomadura flavalba]|uniref:Zn-ribbon domain-containing OB-fold protein n=1 Tax=Actinomadura flavalba TaxID=1120938 RepID=UPI000364B71A|nr:OB-fold domain-containing protein [Actinomadura flavalba]